MERNGRSAPGCCLPGELHHRRVLTEFVWLRPRAAVIGPASPRLPSCLHELGRGQPSRCPRVDGQAAYEKVFGNTWRIVAASMLHSGQANRQFLCPRQMKVWTGGKHLWSRR